MVRFLILIIVAPALYAGWVGDYLGISRGTLWAYREVKKDSSSGPLGSSVTVDTIRDTTRIIDEFIYQGDSAYLKREISVSDTGGIESLTDTLWEEGDSLMGHVFGPLPILGTLYKIPFEIGESWRVCWDTLYIVDANQDGEDDTLRVAEDSIEVLSLENISVPFGEIEDAFKLRRTIKADGWVSLFGFGVTFEAETYYFQWYKPGLGVVKDSSYETVNGYIGDSLLSREDIWTQKELTYMSREEGIEENRTVKHLCPFTVRGSPLDKELSISFSLNEQACIRVFLYNVLGREVGRIGRCYPGGGHILRYRIEDLPQGVYFLKIYKGGIEIGREKVIKVE